MKQVVTVSKERVIWRFTCANHGCQVTGMFDPKAAIKDKTKNHWLLTARVIDVVIRSTAVKMREFTCLKCGAIFFKFHEDTPELVCKQYPQLKLRKDVIPELISKEIDVDEKGKEIKDGGKEETNTTGNTSTEGNGGAASTD